MKKDVTIYPFATRLLDLRSRAEDGVLQDCWLVPGGRFLISRSMTGVIHLWDLGFTAEAIIKPFPIASMEDVHPKIVGIQPTGDHLGIRLLLSSGSEYVHLSSFS
jgi:hypothetical protein